MILWIWPAAAAVASLGGQIYQGWQSRKNVRDTHELREQLAEKQYDRMQKDIKEMKEYNTPKAQMKRFEEAGLNKNLIYQQGQPGLQQNFPQYQPYEVDFSSRLPYVQDVPGIIDAYQGTKRFMSEQSVRENDAELRQKLRDKGIDMAKAREQLKILSQQHYNEISRGSLIDSQAEKFAQDANLSELQQAFQVTRNDFADEGVDITSGSESSTVIRMLLRIFDVDLDEFGFGQ